MAKILSDKTFPLRDHPKMRYHGVPTWPPDWGGSYEGYDVFPRGEMGVLAGVEKIEADNFYVAQLYLTIEYNGKKYSGSLFFEDINFLDQVYDLLKKNIRKDLVKIGQMEI